ncbi:hypothetical protein [Coleofasciculus sp. FACHB-1120]|uniref:hypothetical protein n=1 Tax=Coleofasciculus sp. FACHB-1120 TaxID=2692783 RepID=UPI00168837F0|nr:hypothetical protein [Coleofasciculus sp. FACHB-1120]MBD2743681.1 hypothetical protein [Coleofasciculus sp. FACHB-1120]
MNNRLMRIGDRLSIPDSRLIRIGNRIFNLNTIDYIEHRTNTLWIYQGGSDSSITLHDAEAEHLWNLLSSSTLDVTPQSQVEEAIATTQT